MRVEYICTRCGATMAQLRLAAVDERVLGLDALTPDERTDIITFDALAERMEVKSICDRCAGARKVGGEGEPRLVH